MAKPKKYSVLEVLNFSEVGVIFEFFSTKNIDFIISDLSRHTGKNIILTNEICYVPTYQNAILLKEYESSKPRYRFSIAPQNYHSILPILDTVNKWLSESAETSHDTQLKISLSFNHHMLETLSSISTMDPTRLILKIDENFIYERFPEQKNSPYALSIKNLAPFNAYINEADVKQNIKYVVSLPSANYYGIDFTKYTQGILECNYIGGKDYPKKNEEIKQILEYFIIKTYQSLNEEEYTQFELNEITKFSQNYDRIRLAYLNPDVFLNEFKDLKVYVNLKFSAQLLKTYWNDIKKPLFEMIINGKMLKGKVNYDTDIPKIQIKDAELRGLMLKNVDIVKCVVSGVFENCDFVSCEIDKARIYNSKFIEYNKINDSYLEKASINNYNDVKGCYIINNEEVVNCEVKDSIVKFATPGKNIKLDESSTLIVKEQPLPKLSQAIEIDEVRDYSWVKAMNKEEDKGFQNDYDPKKYLKRILK